MSLWRLILVFLTLSGCSQVFLGAGEVANWPSMLLLVAANDHESAVFQAVEGRTPDVVVPTLGAAFSLLAEKQASCSGFSSRSIVIASKLTRLSAPIVVTADAGAKGCPLTIRSMVGMRARISGGVAIEHWGGKLTGSRASALVKEARAHVIVLRLKDYELDVINDDGIRDRSSVPRAVAFDVFGSGVRLTNARWPNDGYVKLQKSASTAARYNFVLSPAHVGHWSGETGLRVQGFIHHDYSFEDYPASVVDAKRGILRLDAGKLKYDLGEGQRVAVHNVLAELDRPGEWYLDRDAGAIYLWPVKKDAGQAGVEISKAESLFLFNGASNITLEGVSLDMSRGDAVNIFNSNRVVVRDVQFRNIGVRGVVIDGGADDRIENSRFEMLGVGAIAVAGGDRITLTPSKHVIENNLFRRTAELFRTTSAAVYLNGVGQIVRNNRFEDLPWTSVLYLGNDHLIEGNVFRRTVFETGDAGIVYTGRDWASRGTVIRGNTFLGADVQPERSTKGVYIDDQSGGQTVTGNLFVCVRKPVFIGGGSENKVLSNIFVMSSPAISLDNRGVTWNKRALEDPKSTLRARLGASAYKSDLYRRRYPGLARTMDAKGVPFGNQVEGNTLVGSRESRLYDDADMTNQIGAFDTLPLSDVWKRKKDICRVLWSGGDVPLDAMLKYIQH